MYSIVILAIVVAVRKSEAASSKDLGTSPESSEYVLSSDQIAYFDFDDSSPCGGTGWTKIADLDMTDTSQNCPSGFSQASVSGMRGCCRGDNPTVGSCVSTTYSAQGQSYSEVCGKVSGYQSGSTNAFDRLYRGSGVNDIDSYYVDGVSITRGSPREHIFTYASGFQDTVSVRRKFFQRQCQCPCNDDGRRRLVPRFVRRNYACESGNKESFIDGPMDEVFYPDDPLWDNQSLGPRETGCTSPDYFHRELDSPSTASTADIEVRICADQGTDNEDVLVSAIELYIK